MFVDEEVPFDATKYDAYGWDVTKGYQSYNGTDLKIWDSLGIYDLSREIFETLFSEDNQMFQAIVVGPSGAGKSYLALSMLYNVALRIAQEKYGDMRYWRRVYDYKKNTAIVSPENIIEMMKRQKKHQLYLIDDAFLALDRKDWQQSSHQLINTIFGTERVYNSAVIITIQRSKMVDTIIRDLLGYRVDAMRHKEAKRLGFNRCKPFKLIMNQMSSKSPVYNVYPRSRYVDWEDAFSTLPPKELRDWYDPTRMDAAADIKKGGVEGLNTMKNKINAKHQGTGSPGTKKSDLVKQYVASHDPPYEDKDAFAKYKSTAAKNIGCDKTLIEKVLRGEL